MTGAVHSSVMVTGEAPVRASAQALYATHCAQCHGLGGTGEYVAGAVSAPFLAGVDQAKVVRQVRQGSDHMPPLPSAVLSDAALADLARYAHEALAHPSDQPGRAGPHALDPFAIGAVVWAGVAGLAWLLALLFAEERN